MHEEELFKKIDKSDELLDQTGEGPLLQDLNHSASLDWRSEITAHFQEWLEQVSELEVAERQDERATPDLYSFYQELTALRHESAKGSRRSSDAFAQLGETLQSFSQTLDLFRVRLNDQAQEKNDFAFKSKKALLLSLTEIMSRFYRMEGVLQNPPALPEREKRFWFFKVRPWVKTPDLRWKTEWENLQAGFGILRFHLEQLLKSEEITRIQTLGRSFDSRIMVAVAIAESSELRREPLSVSRVIEEVSPGFLWKEEVLKLAEVKVS